MNNTSKYFILILLCIIVVIVITFIYTDVLSFKYDDNIIEKGDNKFIGKWKLINTTYLLKDEFINNTLKNEYNIEFFENGTCKELKDYKNNSWKWEKWTLRETLGEEYIVFSNDPLPPGGDAFISIFYEFSEDGDFLSLYHAHLMTTRNYYKVK